MSNNALITEYLIHAVVELRLLREAMPDRRERIATAAMKGLLADHTTNGTRADYASWAVAAADALIAELDKKEDGA